MPIKDILIALAVVIIWATHNTVIRMGALEIPPLLFLSLRLFLTGLIFLPWIKKIKKEQIKPLILYAGLVIFGHFATLFVALSLIEASLSVIIAQTATAFSVVLGVVFFKEKDGFRTIIGLIVAYAGLLFIFISPIEGFHLWGSLLMLFSVFLFSLGWAAASRMGDVPFASMISYSFMGAFPFALIASFVLETNHIEYLLRADQWKLTWILAFQVFIVSLSHYFWKEILNRNPTGIVSSFLLSIPFFGVISAYLLLGETLSNAEIIGGMITFIGVGIITIRRNKKNVNQEQDVKV